jgi:hypothetical protein
MSTKAIIPSEASREMIPATLQASNYYAGNDLSVQEEYRAKQEIAEYCKTLSPMQVQAGRLIAKGYSLVVVTKELRLKYPNDKLEFSFIKTVADSPEVLRLVHYLIHLQIMQDGPNKEMRKQMLWRIAVDNEKCDPKESVKALAELNRMEAGNQLPNGFSIVINNVSLERGPLDA